MSSQSPGSSLAVSPAVFSSVLMCGEPLVFTLTSIDWQRSCCHSGRLQNKEAQRRGRYPRIRAMKGCTELPPAVKMAPNLISVSVGV